MIFLGSLILVTPQPSGQSIKSSIDPLAKFKPIGNTGFSQFGYFIIRVSPDRTLELFSTVSFYLSGEPVIYLQRNPKSSFENPEFLIGGSSKEAMISFATSYAYRMELLLWTVAI